MDVAQQPHTLLIPASSRPRPHLSLPVPTSSLDPIISNLIRMLTSYPVWDISYLVAIVFVLGSVLWILNAFFVFMPILAPASAFRDESLVAGGVTAFVGATVFELGSALLMLEAVNENRAGCFGWAVEEVFQREIFGDGEGEGREGDGGGATGRGKAATLGVVRGGSCTHHHANRGNLVGRPVGEPGVDPTPPGARSWVWWPSARELRTHYVWDLGFLACAAQTFGATVFWLSGFTALPGILNHMSRGLTDGIYWTPQVVGGCGFVVSGVLFMVETQERWWRPAPGTLGWHIGLWNLIGGVGFTLSPAFGYAPASWAQYQAACSTFWGSWAFMIGSVLQWYESLEKHPVAIDRQAE